MNGSLCVAHIMWQNGQELGRLWSSSSGQEAYWPHLLQTMSKTECRDIDLDADGYVLNRARLYCDRRDFVVQKGDTGHD